MSFLNSLPNAHLPTVGLNWISISRQYLLAQNAHTCLELEKSLKAQENASYYIKYANELWSSIVFLSNTIVNKSREAFSNVSKAGNSSKLLIDAILGIYLLENTTLAQIYQNFTTSRTVSPAHFIRL